MKKNATFVKAKGRAEIGATRRGKGMKIMAIGRHGLSLSLSTHAVTQHEVRLVQLRFDFYMISCAETASR